MERPLWLTGQEAKAQVLSLGLAEKRSWQLAQGGRQGGLGRPGGCFSYSPEVCTPGSV